MRDDGAGHFGRELAGDGGGTLEPGDEVVMEHPAYPLMWETAEYLGATVKFFERRAEDQFAVKMRMRCSGR